MSEQEAATTVHANALVVDAHHDIALDLLYRRRRGERGSLSQFWGKKLRVGGVNIQILPLFVEGRFLPDMGIRNRIEQLDGIYSDLLDDDSEIQLATTMREIDDILAQGKVAGVLALEGCEGLGGDPAVLRMLYRLGVRMVGFTWFGRNEFADGTDVGDKAGGITPAGKTALKDMFAHNVICDVSHMAPASFWDVAELSSGPFVASHSNARAICDHPRNLSDDQLRAIADSGGVVGLNFYGGFIDTDDSNQTLDRLMDHLAHMVEVVGIEHIGIGPDFLEDSLREVSVNALIDGDLDPAMLDYWIPDCQRVDELPAFTAAMLKRGFSEEECKKVLGENFRRVFEQVWG